MDKGTVFEHAASCARLNKCSFSAPVSELKALLRRSCKEINAVYRLVERRFEGRASMPDSCRWLLDNRYLAVRKARSALCELRGQRRLRAGSEGIVISAACRDMLNVCGGSLDEKLLLEYLRGFQSAAPLPQRELYLLPAVLTVQLTAALAAACGQLEKSSEPETLTERFAALFGSLRLVSELDMSSLLRRVDCVEKALMADPAGIYPRMDEQSRAQYREAVTRLAPREGLEEHAFAKKLVEKCRFKNGIEQHVGYWLCKRPNVQRRAALYIGANIIMTLFLTLLCGFLSRSAAVAALLLLPLSELTKSLLDYIILLIVPPRRLPRLELSAGVPDSGRTVCLISALLSDEESGVHFAALLEQYRLANRDCGKNLLMGILADLREADSETAPDDEAVISAAAQAIDRLNEKYGGDFYLFTRGRRLDSGRRTYTGFERKRGAILELARLLCGRKSELRIVSGDGGALRGVPYILTLDSDTVPSPCSVSELIGAMLHPMNAPVLDRERGCVVSGHGIIHPRMCTCLRSACATDFARIFSGGGGLEPYGALCGEVGMDLFGCGGFSGKGIIDAQALLVCSEKHIPNGRVLSHDALEGAYLHGGYMSDVEFSDSFPASPLAYFRRSHRWIRGDWQNIGWIFKKSAGLPDIERWKLFDSLRRSLTAPASFTAVFAGLLLARHGLLLAAWAALISLAAGLLISLAELASDRPEALRARYHSRVFGRFGASIVGTAFRLWLLPYEAWTALSAIVTALWRMLVSGRNLLEWETAAQGGSKRTGIVGYYKSMWLAPVSGLCLILFSAGVFAKAAGLLWCLAPIAAFALALPSKKEKEPSPDERSYLLGCAKDIWSYFDSFCTEQDNFLPPDNFQEQPPSGIAHRTSPTNIGLALCSAMCAQQLGIISLESAVGFISRMLGTVEKLPRYGGHLCNWYDTRTLRPLEPRYLSAVDCGNLSACLIALRGWLHVKGLAELSGRVQSLISDMDLSIFYSFRRGLMHIGIDLEKGAASPGLYDLMASEARLTSYTAVAKGDVPRRHWRRLSRVMRSFHGYRGMASWTGTMFEYLMPELFLPLERDSLLYETARFCAYVQKKRRSPDGVWGISESAFYSLDAALNYRYKAHGCARLALRRGQDTELVIAPYASFLALCIEPDAAIRNLRRLEGLGMRSGCGFFEAADYTPPRCRASGGEIVRCFMAHHLGMSMLAAANYLDRSFVQRMFMLSPDMAAYRQLLAERVPLGAPVLHLSEAESGKESPLKCRRWEKRGGSVNYAQPQCCLLSNGAYNVMLTESGIASASCGDTLVYRTPFRQLGEGHGAELRLLLGTRELSLLPSPSEDAAYMWEFSEISAAYSCVFDDFTARCGIASAGAENGEIRSISLCAKRDIESAELIFSFDAVMADALDYVNHPAYWRLGIEARRDGNCLLLHRLPRGRQEELWLCLACDKPMTAKAGGSIEDGFLSYPSVDASVSVSLKSGEQLELRFALCLAAAPDKAYSGAQHMLVIGPAEYGAMVSACASVTHMTLREMANAMSMLQSLRFVSSKTPFPPKSSLWRCGLSGELPIICCSDAQEAERVTKQFCLLRSCGVYADLVFLTDEGGEYRRPLYSKVLDTLASYGLDALIGTHAGVRILPAEERRLIESAAAFIVGAEREKRLFTAVPKAKKLRRKSGKAPKYEYGSDGSFMFYVNRSLPRRVWSCPLTNGSFGYIAADSGMGNMWLKNAHELRLTPWSNDPLAIDGAESLEFVRGTQRWSLFAGEDGAQCRVTFGHGFAVWEKSFGSCASRCTAFVPPDTDARVFIIEFFGELSGRLDWKCELLLSDSDNDQPAVSCNYVNSTFTASSTRSPLRGLHLRAACSAPPLGWTCDGLSWMHGEFDERTSELSWPVFAAQYESSDVTVLVCGCVEEDILLKLCKPDEAFAALEKTKAHWARICGRVSVTGCGSADRCMSGWAVYQTLACRIMGRCSVYQSGGAFGFRDQLQDAVNLILLDPELAKQQILACCRHQYLEGDVMHWWHGTGGADKGVRTRCSDDLLWLVWALCEYVEKTGDTSICGKLEYYVNSKPLDSAETDRYETPLRSDCSESVLSHARRAIDCCAERGTGSHGLLRFGSGDWNDGMNGVFGESVWLSWFFSCCVRRFAELLAELGCSGADRYRALAAAAGKAADRAWNGNWYLRGYWPDGAELGSAQSECCRIDSIAQSWACFCAEAANSKAERALDSALEKLFDRENGIVRLFDPPFCGSGRDPGYIRSYGPGFRENGGQYTHAAIWLAQACFRRGRANDGWEILRSILPEEHDASRYMAEPFVIPADVYTCPGHVGEAGWTWYTGSSGWYFRVFTEELLGIKPWHGRIYIRPCLPDNFPDCRVRLTTRAGKTHDIVIGREGILLDGAIYDGKGIPYI